MEAVRRNLLTVRITVLCLALLGLVESSEAETLFIRGRRGPIVANDSNRLLKARTFKSAPNLVFFNGGIFERDRLGKFHSLKIDMRSGRLLGAREAATAPQLATMLAKNIGKFSGRALQAISKFVRANFSPAATGTARAPQRSASPSAAAQLPPGSGRQDDSVTLDQKDGKHGQGTAVNTSPRGGTSARRASADEGVEDTSGVCTNLHAALCSGPTKQNAERVAADKKRSTVLSFLREARLDGGTFASIMSGILDDPNRFGKAYSAFTGFLSGKIGSDVKEALSTARSSLLAAVDTQRLSAANKNAVRDRLSSVKFRFAPNFKSFKSLEAFVSNCGPDGMGDGAFASPSEGEVVICPGIIFGAAGKGGDLVTHLTHVIAHEMGHHCGADKVPGSATGFGAFKPLYGNMERCYSGSYPALDKSKYGEVAADTWGVEAVAVQLRGKSPSEALAFLKNAMSPLCSTAGSEEHPPGSFRLNITLGRNPRIREALACSAPTSERPACTLGGTEPDGL